MTLYNVRTASGEDNYRVTKFDEDFNVEATYDLTHSPRWGWSCNCHAGQRATCRHREMIVWFIKYDAVNKNLFLDYDKKKWSSL